MIKVLIADDSALMRKLLKRIFDNDPGITTAEESAIVFGMPGDTIKRGGAQVVAPIWNIAREIMRAVNN